MTYHRNEDGNCISQEGVVFGDDDLRRNGKPSVCPLRTTT